MAYDEIAARMRYLKNNYRSISSTISSNREFNAGLRRLKRAVLGKRESGAQKRIRLHPTLENAIWAKWRELHPEAVDQWAATEAEIWDTCVFMGRTLKPFRGAPPKSVLLHHVAGFMALYYEATGKRVRGALCKNSLYDPHWSSEGGELLETVWGKIDPSIPRTTLVSQVINLNAPGSIVELGFRGLFPLYDAMLDAETGAIIPAPGVQFEAFFINPPIYFS